MSPWPGYEAEAWGVVSKSSCDVAEAQGDAMLAVGAVMADSGGIGQGRLGDAGEVFAGAGGLFVMDDRVSARDRQREMRGE